MNCGLAEKLGENLGRKISKPYIIVKVVLNRQQAEMVDVIAQRLGMSKSETLRVAFLEYAKSISLITEKICGK